jgi:hypothetical protein
MKLKYVGPKPIISHTGIEFDNNKDDKFTYLNIIVQLLKAVDHDYIEDKTYTYQTDSKRLSLDEIIVELKKYCPNLNMMMNERSKIAEEEVEHDIKRATENNFLDHENKLILKNNIEIMKEYIIQRAINKTAYYCAIDALANILKKDHIDYVIAPMFQKFAHVLHSVQGSLRKQKFPIDTKLDVYQENGKLLVKLKVLNI